MHFLPTEEQCELQQGVRELLSRRMPLDRLAAGFDADLWQALAETGVFTLRHELDLGLADAVLVFEELGRACVAGPLVGTFLAQSYDLGPAMSADRVSVVEAGASPLLLAHRDIATAVLVVGPAPALAPVPDGEPLLGAVDPLTPLHRLNAPPAGMALGDETLGRVFRAEGAVLTAALQVGLAARLTELAVDYAKTREQFGRTIGSFQAVKHLCADMFVRTELARAAVHAAAVTLDGHGSDDHARAVAGAKVLADEAAVSNGRSAVQVHGGMGFTWEVPVHFFLKRAWVHATEFGSADDHLEDLAELL